MTSHRNRPYRSVFADSTPEERAENFERYWVFSQQRSGALLEDEQDASIKKAMLRDFRANPVRSRKPLPTPDVFYRNYVKLVDDPETIDRKTLLLMCIYKFARHEWVGISGAWDAIPTMAEAPDIRYRISRHHLAEEFCHVRLFGEMFRTFHLDNVEWVPLPFPMQQLYGLFPRLPLSLLSPIAFVSELMGVMFYRHVDLLLDDVFADEPEARDRIRELLFEITVDEIAHVGQRRNFFGSTGATVARWLIYPVFKSFFADIPESKLLFDVDLMIAEALAFDYSSVSEAAIRQSWIPTYLGGSTSGHQQDAPSDVSPPASPSRVAYAAPS